MSTSVEQVLIAPQALIDRILQMHAAGEPMPLGVWTDGQTVKFYGLPVVALKLIPMEVGTYQGMRFHISPRSRFIPSPVVLPRAGALEKRAAWLRSLSSRKGGWAR